MARIEKICANCIFFQVDRGAITDPGQQEALLNLAQTTQDENQRRKLVYGKCTAKYTGKNGQLVHFESGTLGLSNCFADDDNGKLLFHPMRNLN